MTYITVDADANEVLNELDHEDILDFIEYSLDSTEVLRRIDQDEIATFLIETEDNLVFTDSSIIKEFLEKKDAYGLMNFIHKVYNQQIGELYESVN